MGVDLPSDSVAVTKATNCIIAHHPRYPHRSSNYLHPLHTLRDVCPADCSRKTCMVSKSKNFGKRRTFHLFDLHECGHALMFAPAHIPLVQYTDLPRAKSRHANGKAAQRKLPANGMNIANSVSNARSRKKAEKLAQKKRLQWLQKRQPHRV